MECPNIRRISIHGLTNQCRAFRWFLCCSRARINANRTIFWIPTRRFSRAKRNRSGWISILFKRQTVCFSQIFIPTELHFSKKKKRKYFVRRTYYCRTTDNVVRASYEIWYSWDNRATVSRVSCDSREIVLRPSCESRTIIFFFIKMVYVGTHDNVIIARQSYDYGKTLSGQPQDSDTTKNRRAKKVHVQFSSHATRQRYDAQYIVCLSYDNHRGPAIWQKIMSRSCIDVPWVRCDQGLSVLEYEMPSQKTFSESTNNPVKGFRIS